MTQNKTQLPSPLSVFQPDPHADRIRRVMAVEAALLAEHGMWHVPDANGDLRYFANHVDAIVQRRLLARRIVELEERFAVIAEQPHGAVLPTLREMANRQRAEYEKTGRLIVGDESAA